jgi:hypothetical protein
MPPRSLAAVVLVAVVLVLGPPIHAGAPLDVNVKEVRAPASAVRTTVEVRDLVPDRFRKVIDGGGLLHLRVQAELWESRPVWDRLVYPAIIRMFRVGRRPPSREITIDDASGSTASYPAVPNPLEVILDLGARDRVASAQQYYVHVIATIGTLAERDVDDVGDAVFGRESETNALGSFGRLVFRTALKVSDYLQSISAETRTSKLAGASILTP